MIDNNTEEAMKQHHRKMLWLELETKNNNNNNIPMTNYINKNLHQ